MDKIETDTATIKNIMLGRTDTATALKREAIDNPVFTAIAYVFAHRQRARHQVTVAALKQAMERQGADFDRAEYQKVLKFLGGLGLGTLKYDTKGRITSLADIKVTLQSIGQVASNKSPGLSNFKPVRKNKYKRLDITVTKASDEPLKTIRLPEQGKQPKIDILLTVMIDDSPITVPAPRSINLSELGDFLRKFNEWMKK